MAKVNNKEYVIIFVEGDTDKPFFDTLLDYYKNKTSNMKSYTIVNLKGVANYGKVGAKLKNDLLPKLAGKGHKVKSIFCSYDTDAFEFSQKPQVNWSKVKKDVEELGLKFNRISVKRMIEDWFLDDIDGICDYIKLDKNHRPKNINGKDGNDKLKSIYKQRNKIYKKGSNSSQLIKCLNIEKIRNCRKDELKSLEKELRVKL